MAYQPLFSVEVEHTYFADAACRGMQLRPTAASAAMLANTGCLLRPLRNGVAVAFDNEATDAVRMQARDPHDPFTLCFLGSTPDVLFSNYTDLPGTAGSLPWFHSDAAVPEDSGTLRLHAQPYVAAADQRALNSPPVSELLTRNEQRVPPRFIVQVRVAEGDLLAGGRRYLLRFQARTTVWKYYLVGDWVSGWTQDEVTVVDLGSDTGFDAALPEPLPNGRTALAVRSQDRIALHERPAHRFQLRGRSGGTERVLIKRLPVAGSSLLSVETIRGVPTPVSEIYVHR